MPVNTVLITQEVIFQFNLIKRARMAQWVR